MNLIEKFENKPFQDVGTFNAIFTKTPILGFDSNTPVEIKNIVAGKRRVLVGNSEIFLDLRMRSAPIAEIKKTREGRKVKVRRVSEKKKLKLPDFYRMLKPSEFVVYSAIKEAKEIDGMEELSRVIGITNKTIAQTIKRLVKLKLVQTECVAGPSGSFTKIKIDTSSLLEQNTTNANNKQEENA